MLGDAAVEEAIELPPSSSETAAPAAVVGDEEDSGLSPVLDDPLRPVVSV
jgi:hypothetical protein